VASSSKPVIGRDDERVRAAKPEQRLGDRLLVAAVRDAEQLPARAGRVGQRAEEVEDRPHRELLAHRHHMGHRLVVARANMKPKPTSSMQRPTSSGESSMSTPSASSRSAEPQRLVLERLPCLATAQPAPAATRAAAVETLKVEGPAPGACRVHEVVAAAAHGGGQRAHRPGQPDQLGDGLPLRRSAIRKAAVCTSLDRPSMISARTAAA
jgi:hypothetical protein